MTPQTPDPILAQTQASSGNGRPVRKDEIEIVERGVYVESWLPERRSRRKPLVFIHGELAGSWLWERFLHFFASRGWEGHAVNLQNHYWSQTADPAALSFMTYVDDVGAVLERLGPEAVAVGHGLGGLLALAAAAQQPVSGLILLAPELPKPLRPPPRAFELRDVPEVYGRERIGWSTLPEKLLRDHRDLTLADVLRIQHLLGQKPHESGLARRQVMRGIELSIEPLRDLPTLVVGAGLDRYIDEAGTEQLAEWLGAAYEPFGAHSHYGLVMAEQGYQQVAETIRAFLELHRL